MPVYIYKAIDTAGKAVQGTMDAANLQDLELRLRNMGLDLIRSRPFTQRAAGLFGQRKVKRADLINFSFHLEQLTRAGVPIIEGLIDLRDTVTHPRFREVIADVVENIQGGRLLSDALATHPAVFDTVFVSLVRAGEQSGQLTEVLRNLTETLKWQDELAAHTKKLLMYPAFVGTVVLGVTFFLMVYLVPQLVGFIKNMGQELPMHTRALIALSNFMVHYWHALLIAPIGLWLFLRYLLRVSPGARFRADGLKLRVWLVGPILRKIILARFANFFALMYASGITIIEAMKTSENIVANRVIADGLRRAGQQINEGSSVTSAFQSIGLFPPLVIRMLKVGETTGALDTALRNVSYFYDREVKEAIGRLQTLIEPAMTVIMGLILGWVMLSVLGPIYDTISKLKT